MNWLAFFIVAGGFSAMVLAIVAISIAGDWLDKRVGAGWSIVIVLGGLGLGVSAIAGALL